MKLDYAIISEVAAEAGFTLKITKMEGGLGLPTFYLCKDGTQLNLFGHNPFEPGPQNYSYCREENENFSMVNADLEEICDYIRGLK